MRILLIEDDYELCDAVSFHLKKAGYEIDYCCDGEEGLYFAKQQAYEMILLDRMLPSLNGISLLMQMRSLGVHTPVIMLTALNGIGDRVEGLDAGADDYLVKPFAMEELLARIRALNRRPSQLESIHTFSYGDLTLNLMAASLSGPLGSCTLSKREIQLAEVFLKNPNYILPRNIILARVWGPDAAIEDGNLDNYIYYLRRRLQAVGSHLQIKTIRSIGYTLENRDAK
jgi:DNA-binding response OmpR family regulator